MSRQRYSRLKVSKQNTLMKQQPFDLKKKKKGFVRSVLVFQPRTDQQCSFDSGCCDATSVP